MPKFIGQFDSPRYGEVKVCKSYYESNGALAIILVSFDKELQAWTKLCALSVNMDHDQDGVQSQDLPPNHFYVKAYGGQSIIAAEAFQSGLFKKSNLPPIKSGFILAPVWELAPPPKEE